MICTGSQLNKFVDDFKDIKAEGVALASDMATGDWTKDTNNLVKTGTLHQQVMRTILI